MGRQTSVRLAASTFERHPVTSRNRLHPIFRRVIGPIDKTSPPPTPPNQDRPDDAAAEPSGGFTADSLAMGMLVMLAMTILQRGLGFGRGIWFCRMLSDADVGSLSMAQDFIVMMTPIAMMGIPGSLARYVEQFRQKGHLTPMIVRLAGITAALGVLLVCSLLVAPETFGWLIFLRRDATELILAVAVGVAAIVTFNFVYELLASLRQVRMASWMQFIQSVGFSVVGVGWLYAGGSLAGLVGVFAAMTFLAVVPGVIYLHRRWNGGRATTAFDAGSMWRRLLPYAAALWAMNIVMNLFGMSDRYMILHWLPGDENVTRAAVGQYHSARIVPLLLTSLAAMVSGVLMPYLAADWEAGRRGEVITKLRQSIAAMSVLFTIGGSLTLLLAPWLFGELLQGRYAEGLSLMPMAMIYCTWGSLAIIAQDYLWVAERGKWVGVAITIGLVLNVALNMALMPSYGIYGAVMATTIANAAVLLAIWTTMWAMGFRLDRDTITMTLLPATMLGGGWVALGCTASVVLTTPTIIDAIGQCRSLASQRLENFQARRNGKLSSTAA